MTIRIAMLLPGLGRVQRGAETAFLEIASGLDAYDDMQVTLFGQGQDVPAGLSIHAVPCTPREKFERWPKLPGFRSECHYEEWSFVRGLKRTRAFDAREFDVTISCTYPWINWYLQKAKRQHPSLRNLFVTQNGDWMCRSDSREYRYFACDGLAVINPDHLVAHRERYNTRLIPNGTDPARFFPADDSERGVPLQLDEPLPQDKTIVLMVSALIESKRVIEGLKATAQVEDAYFVVAGDGPLREEVVKLAEELMPGRYRLLGSLPRDRMPALFRQADVFLHMSQIEPFGIVYLEAGASGLTIVTHDGPTPRWILGDTALFADSDDPERVADAIREATEPAIRTELGRAARERVTADWTWQAQAAKYRQFIRSLQGLDEAEQSAERNTDAVDRHRELQHA